MNKRISNILKKYSNQVTEAEKYDICLELSGLQRSFKWDEWEFGFGLLKRHQLIEQLSKENLLRIMLLIVESEKLTPGVFKNSIETGFLDKIIQQLNSIFQQMNALPTTNIKIDPNYDFRSDTPPNKDPDLYSETLRNYHKKLWSKTLPNGDLFNLSDNETGNYLYYRTNFVELNLTSDCITHSYRDVARMQSVVRQVPENEMESFFNSLYSIGGYTLFPGGVRKGFQTINQARGCHPRIVDRIDLTLECVKRFYENQDNPLQKTFEGYKDFFGLFETFKGFVDFFHFQDLVSKDYNEIRFILPFDSSFPSRPFPRDLDEYRLHIKNTQAFVSARTERLLAV